MSDDLITQALIDPHWETGVMTVGEVRLGFIRLNHPAIGPIISIIPKETALKLGGMLSDLGNSLPQ